MSAKMGLPDLRKILLNNVEQLLYKRVDMPPFTANLENVFIEIMRHRYGREFCSQLQRLYACKPHVFRDASDLTLNFSMLLGGSPQSGIVKGSVICPAPDEGFPVVAELAPPFLRRQESLQVNVRLDDLDSLPPSLKRMCAAAFRHLLRAAAKNNERDEAMKFLEWYLRQVRTIGQINRTWPELLLRAGNYTEYDLKISAKSKIPQFVHGAAKNPVQYKVVKKDIERLTEWLVEGLLATHANGTILTTSDRIPASRYRPRLSYKDKDKDKDKDKETANG